MTALPATPTAPFPDTTGVATAIPRRTRLAWTLGITGAALLVLGGLVAGISGSSMSGARNSLTAADPQTNYLLLAHIATICADDSASFPGRPQPAVCNALLVDGRLPARNDTTRPYMWDGAKAVAALDAAKACVGNGANEGCNVVWRAAVALDQDQIWKRSYFGALHLFSGFLTGRAESGSASILTPLATVIAGLVLMVVALGLGTKQRVAGMWIDTRNRVSLARAQITLWTIVALAGYMTFAMFNVGFSDIVTSASEMSRYQAFPAIPASIAAALGIATTSTMLSALILPTKDRSGGTIDIDVRGGDPTDPRKRGLPFFGMESEGLDRRTSPADASIADVFMGEEKANADTVDIARLQNVVITITLVLGFLLQLIGLSRSISVTTMLDAKNSIFASLPEFNAAFTSLLLASHATYLVAKAHDAQS